MMNRPVRLKDIAKKLDLSAMTISRALNDHPDVNRETRRLVHRTAKAMGYRPNQLARGLVQRRSRVIGLIVPDISHSFFAGIGLGIQETLSRRGYSLFLGNSHDRPDLEIQEVESFLDRRADGMIIASSLAQHEAKRLSEVVSTPCVLVDRIPDPDSFSYVVCDDFKVGFLATEHLLRQGHRRVAHIAGPRVSTAERRHEGYRAALESYGLVYDPDLVRVEGFEWKHGRRAANWILHRDRPPDAVFAVNDLVAFGILETFREQRIAVPEDVALIGAGDIQGGALAYAPLSTIRFPTFQIGRAAAELLLDRIEFAARGETTESLPPKRVVMEPKLVVRSSCGAELSSEATKEGSADLISPITGG